MDFVREIILKKKKSVQDVMSIIITVMVAFMLFYLILIQFATGKLAIFIPIEIAAVIYGMYLAITSLNVEYEYSVINGWMDVDKIIAGKRRKNVAKIEVKNVEYFARFDDKHMGVAEDESVEKVIDATTTIDSPKVYFMIYYNNNKKICLLFEPTDEMIENFSHYVPRSLNHTL